MPFVLKCADTFAALDASGDVRPEAGPGLGVFHRDTRHVSRLELRFWDERPSLLSSAVREDNSLLVSHLTNQEIEHAGPAATDRRLPQGTIRVQRTSAIDASGIGQRLRFESRADHPVRVPVSIHFDADFRDIFELRGARRPRRGTTTALDGPGWFGVRYAGLDGVTRAARIAVDRPADRAGGGRIGFTVDLPARGTAAAHVAIEFGADRPPPDAAARFGALEQGSLDRFRRFTDSAARIRTSNPRFNGWLDRSLADVALLSAPAGGGLYPHAGIPWYACPFGRDGLITARQCLWFKPELARGVLALLADAQADADEPERDAQPGKIVHELRHGETAALNEVPFGRYYGTVDATPLFVWLAGAYLDRTGDTGFLGAIWPNIERALAWMRGPSLVGGYLTHPRRPDAGLINQGWKDSHDAVFHADGSDPSGPIALVEVQAYLYGALRAAARIARALGRRDAIAPLIDEARALRERFARDFWVEELGTLALALDAGERRRCAVVTSNAGHVLLTGIASPEHAAGVVRSLLSPTMFCGWGVRTLDARMPRYDPMSYHNGSVWPHDNALIALGLARAGHKDAVLSVLGAMFDLSRYMPMHRLPELICGFDRRPDEGPTPYPVTCMPQAWAAGAAFGLVEAALGLSLRIGRDGRGEVRLDNPALPPFLDEVELESLRVGDECVDLALERKGGEVRVHVRRGSPAVRVRVRRP